MEDCKELQTLKNPEAITEDGERKLPNWMLSNQLPSVEDDGSLLPTDASLNDSQDKKDEVSSNKRNSCKYGASCYRRNPNHKKEFSHPGDQDYQPSLPSESPQDATADDKPECPFGIACYRQNVQHKRDFKHTQPHQSNCALKKRKRRHEATKDEDHESDGDNEYDLDDSFIDDNQSSEEDDSEDEDYMPINNDNDPELLNEDEWKASTEDTPEVLELLKEARDYLRNKKLHK